MIVAGANLVAVALWIATFSPRPNQLDGSGMCAEIVVVGALPAIVGGALLGWLAARLEVRRATVLVGIALAAVAAVGWLTERRWIAPAELSTAIAMLGLERWTRRARGEPSPPVHPMTCGALLAMATVAAIALVVGLVYQHELELLGDFGPYPPSYGYPGFKAALGLFVGGAPFAVLAGAGFGALAARLAKASPVARCAILGGPVVAIVAAIGDLAMHDELVLPALGPALIAVLVLERVTRSQPALATARAIQR
jgi:MFS family permease